MGGFTHNSARVRCLSTRRFINDAGQGKTMSDTERSLDVLLDDEEDARSVEAAIETQDRLRAKTNDWSGAAVIREWRDRRRS